MGTALKANPIPATLSATEAALAATLGFYIEERVSIPVLVFLSQGCHPASSSENALWLSLVATAGKNQRLQASVERFFENAILNKSDDEEYNDTSICIDCQSLVGSPHSASCEIAALRLALSKSLSEKI